MYSVDPSSQAELVKRDATTGKVIDRLPVQGSIRSLAVSPDGEEIALGVGAMDGESGHPAAAVLFCESRTLKLSGRHDAPGPWWANAVAFSSDGSKVVVGYAPNDSGWTGGAQVLDRSGKAVPALAIPIPEGQGVSSVAFHPDGRRVALGSFERIVIDDLGDEEPPEILESRHRGWIYALAFSPDGRYLAAAGWGSTIQVMETATRRLIHRLSDPRGFVRGLSFSPDSSHLASVGEDRSVRLWHVKTGQPVAAFHGHSQYTFSVAWHPEGRLLASGGGDHSIKLWDVRKSRPIVKWHFGLPTGLAFDPSSEHGAIASQATLDMTNGQYQLWDPATGRSLNGTDLAFDPASAPSFGEAARAQGMKPVQNLSIFSSVAFSRDGQLIAFQSGPNAIEVRETGKGTLIRRLESEESVLSIAFTLDGSGLVAGGNNGWFALWNLAMNRREWVQFRGGERG